MLSPEEICRLFTVNAKDLPLDAEERGYGIRSGKCYAPGQNRLDAADRGHSVLVYWTSFSTDVTGQFLGRIPTADNLYDLKAVATFDSQQPEAMYRRLLHGAEAIVLADFARDLGERMQPILSRLACRFAPEQLALGGAAQTEAEQWIKAELSRQYEADGLAAAKVCLQCVRHYGDQFQAKLIALRVRGEAEEQKRALEEVFQQEKREIQQKANEGDAAAKTVMASLANIGSYGQLAALVPAEPKDVVAAPVVDSRRPAARVSVKAVLVGAKNQCGGRFAVLSGQEKPRYYEIARPWFCVGRDANCHVSLPDPTVSSLHATFARIGSGLAVVDHQSRNGTLLGGERAAQGFLETGDVLRIGPFWIIFKLEPGQEFRQIDRSCRGAIEPPGRTRPVAGESSDELAGPSPPAAATASVQLFSSTGRNVTSNSRPILIGEDSVCNLRLGGGGAARFHAVVFWDVVTDAAGKIADAGVFVEDLHTGHGLLCNGQPASKRTKLADGDVIEIGGHRITVSCLGDVRRQAESLHAAWPKTRGLAITCVEGVGAGASIKLEPNRPQLVLGRAAPCDFILPSEEISDRHAEIVPQMVDCGNGSYRPAFALKDLESTNGTYVNGSPLPPHQPRQLGAGDIVRLSNGRKRCDLLVHYDL